MSSKISSQSSVTGIWRNVAVAVFAVCFALLGLCVTVIPTRAADDDTFITIGEIYNNPANMQKLYDAVGGVTGTTYAQIADLAEQKQNAQNFRELNNGQDIKVMFGGYEWHVCYLSQTNETKPRPILTLYMSNALDNQVYQWNTHIDTAGTTYYCVVYGTSYMRAVVLNNGGLYATSATQAENATPKNKHSLSAFTNGGSLTNCLVTPSKVDWQKQQNSITFGAYYKLHNEQYAVDESNEGYAGVGNLTKTTNYGVWQDDYVWLPSWSEVQSGKLWKLSSQQVPHGSWLRSGYSEFQLNGDYVNAGFTNTARLGIFDGSMWDMVNTSYYVRPALHIDLSAPELWTDWAEQPTDVTVTYNGTDQPLSKIKPNWYRDDMQITYTKDGQPATVKDAGEYTATVRLGGLEQTITITVNPRAVTVEGLKANDKTYDGTASVNIDKSDVKFSGDGKMTNDNLDVNIVSSKFTDKNVGEKSVPVTIELTGDFAHNYVLTNPEIELMANITSRTVTIKNITTKDKTYDGTPTAFLDTSKIDYTNKVAGDDLTVAVTGTFTQVTVGTDIPVTLGIELVGDDAANYKIAANSQQDTTGNITKRFITVTINDQTVKVGDAVNLTARVTSGSLANGDNADEVYTLAIELPADAEYDINNLPAGEYTITGAVADTDTAKNYEMTFVNGKYTVLTAEAWDALQTKDNESKGDNNAWLVIIIVIAVAAFIGALVGIGLVVRSHDRTPKPAKEKPAKKDKSMVKDKDTNQTTDVAQTASADNAN